MHEVLNHEVPDWSHCTSLWIQQVWFVTCIFQIISEDQYIDWLNENYIKLMLKTNNRVVSSDSGVLESSPCKTVYSDYRNTLSTLRDKS